MIQDIAPKKLYNEYHPEMICTPDDFVLSFDGKSLLVADGEALRFPRLRELPTSVAAGGLTYLFSVDRDHFYLAAPIAAPAGFSYVPLRNLADEKIGGHDLFYAAYTAMHLAIWYGDNRFCGRCGTKTGFSSTERALVCPHCGNTIYPRLIPAVIAGVIDPESDRIVLTKYAHRAMAFYALIAGFTEIGETLEECVKREVYEETGLYVKNLRYYASQPWGTVQDILAGFYCDVDGSTKIRMERTELKEAIWVPREEVVGQTNDFSLTHAMMMAFRDGKEPR